MDEPEFDMEKFEQEMEEMKQRFAETNQRIAESDLKFETLLYGGPLAVVMPEAINALKLAEEAVPLDEKELCKCLLKLATLYERQSQYTEAEALYLRALAILEKIKGTEDLSVAQCLECIASVHKGNNEKQKTMELYERALKIRDNTPNPEDTEEWDIFNALDCLGTTYYEEGMYVEAEVIIKRKLEIAEQYGGKRYKLQLPMCLEQISWVYRKTNRNEEAMGLVLRALDLYKSIIGPENGIIAICIDNIAGLHVDMGDYDVAEAMYEQSLEMCKKDDEPDSMSAGRAPTMTHLAKLYILQARYQEAELLLDIALPRLEDYVLCSEEMLIETLEVIVLLYMKTDRVNEAEKVEKRISRLRSKEEKASDAFFRKFKTTDCFDDLEE